MADLNCIHTETGVGLCEQCQADYDEDPMAYVEFGYHPEGIRRWREEEASILADRVVPFTTPVDQDIPF